MTNAATKTVRLYHCPLAEQPDGTFLCPDCKRPAAGFKHRKCSAVVEPKRVDLSLMMIGCQHNAGTARNARCESCTGELKIKIFRCSLHGGECDVTGKFQELRQCLTCSDFSGPSP